MDGVVKPEQCTHTPHPFCLDATFSPSQTKNNPPLLMVSHMCTPTQMNAHPAHVHTPIAFPPSLPQGAKVLHQLLNCLSRLIG